MKTEELTLRRREWFRTVARHALQSAESLLAYWLPDGRKSGEEWVARNPTREDKKNGSFKINISSGVWRDFASDHGGADLISLHAYLTGVRNTDSAKEICNILGLALPYPQSMEIIGTPRVLAQRARNLDHPPPKSHHFQYCLSLMTPRCHLRGIHRVESHQPHGYTEMKMDG